MIKPQLDVLIVPGSVREKERYFRAIAAGYCLKNNITKNIILSGGKTKKVIESESMLTTMLEIFPQDIKIKIFLEKQSTDTTSNIINSINLMKEHNWNKIGILSSNYHLKRCAHLARIYGINAEIISTEEIFLKLNKQELDNFNNYMKSNEMQSVMRLEKFLNKLMILDSKGMLTRITSKIHYKVLH